MKYLNHLLILVALTLSQILSAQNTGEIQGKVFDLSSGEPLIGTSVFVRIGGSLIGTASDIDGRFTIKPLNSGIYNVEFSYMGYKEQKYTNVQVNPDKITILDPMKLAPDMAMFDSIPVIYGWKQKLIDPEDPGKMSITATHLKNNPNLRSPLKMISTLIPGVTESRDGEGLHFRGSRTNAIAYFIDGVKQGDNFSPIPSSAIGSMTVYTGGLPAKYGDVTGGVIVIETKSFFDLYNAQVAQDEMEQLNKKKN